MIRPIIETADWDRDKDELIKLRTLVFVEEQQVPISVEVDGLDSDCMHVKALMGDCYVGTGRLLPNGFIGRMCVLQNYRNQGIGRGMLENLIQQARAAGCPRVLLNAQSYAIPFYLKNGFIIDSEEFIEAGIPHQRMVLNSAQYL
ncbi:MAG: GNAT family N-acetyltransferase [Proteobacteria bacterium]|nr:GNAT family N-acetyltransferase [Pseudomonadota bacterium]